MHLVCIRDVLQEGLVQVAKFNSTDEMHVYLIRALLANLLDSRCFFQLAAASTAVTTLIPPGRNSGAGAGACWYWCWCWPGAGAGTAAGGADVGS